MELRHLKYFVAVAEELNFRRAAQVVHIAQPALSQQIKQLEGELGVALFARSHHKVELTAAGKTFYASAQMILKEARQAVADARSAFQAAGVMPERIYHTSLLQTGVLLVGAGLGISLVPESFQRIKVQGVVYRPLAMASPTIDLIAAWRRDNTSPLLARITKEIKGHSAALLATV